MKTKLQTITLPRRKWYRGLQFDSELLREDGKQCCLGIACSAMEVPNAHILGVAKLEFLDREPPVALKALILRGEETLLELYRVNDSPEIRSDRTRVRKLNALLKAADATFRFALSAAK